MNEENNFEQVFKEYKAQGDQQARMESSNEVAPGKDQIIAVRKNDDGDIIAFKTSSGRELDYLSALDEAKSGYLANVDVFHKYGRDIIRSEPDGIKENNLDQLPSF